MTAARFRIMAMLAVLVFVGASATSAQGSGGDDEGKAKARLIGYREVPAISTEGDGTFRARMMGDDAFTFRLSYDDLSSHVQQAHIHFGQKGVNGGIAVFLCSNLGNGPAGTPPCPQPAPGETATVEGTRTAADVIGPAAQGIAPGQFDELVRALRAGVAYANVHSQQWPAGEIRGQFDRRGH